MTLAEETLLQLLRLSFGGDVRDCDLQALRDEDWRELIKLSFEQGVVAIAVDGYHKWLDSAGDEGQKCSFNCDNSSDDVKYEWLGSVLQAEEEYERQWKAARRMADIFASNGIRTRVIKGFSVAALYPEPSHRECCDCDVFLGENYELGNCLMERERVRVDRSYYKNSTFFYKGLMVENHRFCSPVRGFSRRKKYEKYLRSIIDDGATPLGNSAIWRPGPLFTAIFTTSHAQIHFLLENGISLRHVCDFALSLRDLDSCGGWGEYERRCREFGLWKFALAMGTAAKRVTGIELPFISDGAVSTAGRHCSDAGNPQPSAASQTHTPADRLLEEIFTAAHITGQPVPESGSKLFRRLAIVRSIIRGRWKFPLYSEHSVFFTLFEIIASFLLRRD